MKAALIILGIIISVIFLLSVVLAAMSMFIDSIEERKHLEFLSEKVGYKVLSLEEWCESKNIEYKKYRNDTTVKTEYRHYLSSAETKAVFNIAKGV